MTETYTAVLDRIVDGETAVLLLEADESVIDELALAVERLPEAGRHEGAVFDVEFDETPDESDAGRTVDELRETTYRPAVEEERRQSLRDRFDRLSERLSEE